LRQQILARECVFENQPDRRELYVGSEALGRHCQCVSWGGDVCDLDEVMLSCLLEVSHANLGIGVILTLLGALIFAPPRRTAAMLHFTSRTSALACGYGGVAAGGSRLRGRSEGLGGRGCSRIDAVATDQALAIVRKMYEACVVSSRGEGQKAA